MHHYTILATLAVLTAASAQQPWGSNQDAKLLVRSVSANGTSAPYGIPSASGSAVSGRVPASTGALVPSGLPPLLPSGLPPLLPSGLPPLLPSGPVPSGAPAPLPSGAPGPGPGGPGGPGSPGNPGGPDIPGNPNGQGGPGGPGGLGSPVNNPGGPDIPGNPNGQWGPGNQGGQDGLAHGNRTLSDAGRCLDLQHLLSFINLASNAAWLNATTNGNATQIAAFQAQVAKAQTKVTAYQSNATLISECDAISALDTSRRDCQKMNFLQKLESNAANDTQLGIIFQGNQTAIDSFKARAAAQLSDLNTLQGNASLNVFCANDKARMQCERIVAIQRQLNSRGNSSRGNQNQVAGVHQINANRSLAQLTNLSSNATLVSLCPSLVQNFSMINIAGLTQANAPADGAAPHMSGLSSAIIVALVTLSVAMLSF